MTELNAVPTYRLDLQAELAATRAAVQRILAGMSDADWRRRSANPTWTVGQVLTHLTWSLEHVPREVEGARKGRGMYNLPPILFGPLNMLATRLVARRYTRQTLAQHYDAAYAAALRTLEGVGDDEWRRGAHFFGEGFKDIEELFRGQARHLAEHGRDIWAVLPWAPEGALGSEPAAGSG
jgi:hypothetical protein